MSTIQQPDVMVTVTPGASVEVKKFMDAENVDPAHGGLRVSVQPGGCSGFKYGLLIEDAPAEDDLVVDQGGWKVFVDPFSAQYINGVTIDYVSSMQGSGCTTKKSRSWWPIASRRSSKNATRRVPTRCSVWRPALRPSVCTASSFGSTRKRDSASGTW